MSSGSNKLAGCLAPLATRFVQMLLDPFAVLGPALPALVQRIGLCRNTARYVNPQRLARGLVMVLPGIEGPGFYASGIRRGLAAPADRSARAAQPTDAPGAAEAAAVSVMNWAGLVPGICYAFSPRLQQRALGRLLRAIQEYRAAFPGRAAPPVVLAGHSGGAAMAIFTDEAMAAHFPGEPLAGIVAIATPLHPDYDHIFESLNEEACFTCINDQSCALI